MNCKDCQTYKKCKNCRKETIARIRQELYAILGHDNSGDFYVGAGDDTILAGEKIINDCENGLLLFPRSPEDTQDYFIDLNDNYFLAYTNCKTIDDVYILGDLGKTNTRFVMDSYYKFCLKYINVNYSLPKTPYIEWNINVKSIINLPQARKIDDNTCLIGLVDRFVARFEFSRLKQYLSPVMPYGDIRSKIFNLKFDSRIFTTEVMPDGKVKIVLTSFFTEQRNEVRSIIRNINIQLNQLVLQLKQAIIEKNKLNSYVNTRRPNQKSIGNSKI